MFDPVRKKQRMKANFSIHPETYAMIKRLAIAYETSQSNILDAIFETYGGSLLRDSAKRKR